MTKLAHQWYASWFNTPYYHILYKDRDDSEAQIFMDNLVNYLNLPPNSSILDLACGKGRHAVYLNQLGFDVTGVDLSEQSIAYARQFENTGLKFEVHDMTEPYDAKFDAVFNLFTSFGYFEEDACHLKTIKAIKSELHPGGFGVIDFMNVNFVLKNLVADNTKTIDGISFRQQRKFEDGYILKEINFTVDEEEHYYKERVKALKLEDFKDLFGKADVQLLEVFGDYKLNPFDPDQSERLIMIFK